MAQIAEPLAAADISAYYISTFNFDHALVSPAPPRGPLSVPGVSPEADTPLSPGRSPRRALLRSSSCCSSGRRAADSGRPRAARPSAVSALLPTLEQLKLFILMIPRHRTEPGTASHSLCAGDEADLGTWWPCGRGQWPTGEGSGCHPLPPAQPVQGGWPRDSGCVQVEGTRGDMPKSSDVPLWCYRGQPGADGMCPLGKGAVATMLRDTPGLAPWSGEHSWSWGYPWHPKNLQRGSGGGSGSTPALVVTCHGGVTVTPSPSQVVFSHSFW